MPLKSINPSFTFTSPSQIWFSVLGFNRHLCSVIKDDCYAYDGHSSDEREKAKEKKNNYHEGLATVLSYYRIRLEWEMDASSEEAFSYVCMVTHSSATKKEVEPTNRASLSLREFGFDDQSLPLIDCFDLVSLFLRHIKPDGIFSTKSFLF